MLSYCLKCKKNTKSKKIQKLEKQKPKMVTSNCAVCGSKNLRFIKEQEASVLLRNLTGIKVPILSDLTIANILF